MTHSPSLHLGFRFFTLARQWRRRIDRELAAAGLTDASWTPLIHLAEAGTPLTQSDLAERVGIDGSTLVRIIDILETRGLVARRIPPEDRRTRHLVVTAAGDAEVRALRLRLDAVEAEVLGHLPPETVALMHAAFGSMIEALRAEEGACR